ncbi:SET domain-containing protein [Viridothelium virens]|uniref:SET domain-containing protein n=1 Tax=Viridothelium virens TaxID=1048519 RepID=A0A6A6H7W8_VIRVR|nr:SET domain-containing protein [Viridothelium virens]
MASIYFDTSAQVSHKVFGTDVKPAIVSTPTPISKARIDQNRDDFQYIAFDGSVRVANMAYTDHLGTSFEAEPGFQNHVTLHPNWNNVPKPRHLKSVHVWDPTEPSSILNAVSDPFLQCIGHACRNPAGYWCGCELSVRRAASLSTFGSRLELRETHGKGIGVFVICGSSIPQKTFIGDYTGMLTLREDLPGFRDTHAMEIGIGREDEGKQGMAMIDGFYDGGWVRFVNHSCPPNCEVFEMRVGKTKVLALQTVREIRSGEELTFDYGDDFFQKSRICMCGEARCRHPPKESAKRKCRTYDDDYEPQMARKRRPATLSSRKKSVR